MSRTILFMALSLLIGEPLFGAQRQDPGEKHSAKVNREIAEKAETRDTNTFPYRINRWDHRLGNHRVLVRVDDAAAGAVKVLIPWRRRAPDAASLDVVVIGPKESVIKNRRLVSASRESAELWFAPIDGKGLYLVYYQIPDWDLVRPFGLQRHFSHTVYKEYSETASEAWLDEVRNRHKSIPLVKVDAFEALERFGPERLKDFNSFYPMEVIATADETRRIEEANAGAKFVLFPEDREHSIRMTDNLPYRWIDGKDRRSLDVQAAAGQYVVFQIGIFAIANVSNIGVVFGPLSKQDGTLVSEDKMTCFNLGGVDWAGRSFSKTVNISKGEVQALWCGIDLPHAVDPGRYDGIVTVTGNGGTAKQSFTIHLHVKEQAIAHRGDDDPWNLSRLRWLNSKIGIDDKPIPPYTPIEAADGNIFHILGRKIVLGELGLPASAVSYISMDRINAAGREILASPVSLDVETSQGRQSFLMKGVEITKRAGGKVAFQTCGESAQLSLACQGSLESDGYLRYQVTLTGKKGTQIQDVVLRVPFKKDIAKYAMGKFGPSGFMPDSKTVPIRGGLMYNVVWGGDYNAGLGCWLKNENDEWNADNASKGREPILKTWENQGKGHYQLVNNDREVVYEVHLGERALGEGETVRLDFAMVVTPFKPLTDFRWIKRIYHPSYGSLPSDSQAKPANIVNLHHATVLNPYINYPFIANERLKEKVDSFHREGKKVKIYYTVRELSVTLPEFWALRSLGDEIFIKDGGYLGGLSRNPNELRSGGQRFLRSGYPWMCEHVVTDYRVRWHSHIRDKSNPALSRLVGGETDASIAVQGLSRWHNYYLEGLKWLIQEVGIDGIYLDGIGYDREIMKRVRKTMLAAGKPCTIDFHGAVNNAWITQAPYVESIWYGEGAQYQRGPDYWLVEVSGIPFGLSGGILAGDSSIEANHFRGMLYGISRRIGWSGSFLAVPLWEFLDRFEIEKADQLGYWDPACPVRSPVEQVKVSVYRKKHESLIVVGNWSKQDETVQLDIDWKALGLDPRTAESHLPAIGRHQEARAIDVMNKIEVPASKGLFIVVRDKH